MCKESLKDGAIIQAHEMGTYGINAVCVVRGDSVIATVDCKHKQEMSETLCK